MTRSAWSILLERARGEADRERISVVRASQRVQQLEAQRDRLVTLRADYESRLREAQGQPHAITQSVNYRGFLGQIHGLMERLQQDLVSAEAVLAAARRQLIRAELECSKYELLLEREKGKAHAVEAVAEQRMLDAQGLSRFIQRQRAA
jgi:flagellar export protein FliJ